MLDYVRLVLALLRRRERREVNKMSGVSRVFVAFTSLLACGVRRPCQESRGGRGGYDYAQAVYYNVFSFKMTSCHFLLINGFPFLFFPISRTRRRT